MLEFEPFWHSGPWMKLGKKAAQRHFKASVKTDEDSVAIQLARDKYAEHLQIEVWKRAQHGSTWFNGWRDWLALKPDSRVSVATIEQPPDHNPIHICRACPVEHEWSCVEYPGCAMTKYVACPEVEL